MVSTLVSRTTLGVLITSRTSRRKRTLKAIDQLVAFDGGIDHGLVGAGLFGLPGDFDRAGLQLAAGRDVDAGDVRAFAGKDLRLLAGFEERRGGEHGARLDGARDDLFQVGESAFDQLGDQLDIFQVEDHLAAVRAAAPW